MYSPNTKDEYNQPKLSDHLSGLEKREGLWLESETAEHITINRTRYLMPIAAYRHQKHGIERQ